jgi:tetratricopeptide (TPR) repeat protein
MPKKSTSRPKPARGTTSRGGERGIPSRGGEPARHVIWWIPLVIALATAWAFAPSLQNQFTDWDDPAYVTDQPLVRDLSLSGVQAIFTQVVEGNYHPLTIASLAVDFRFWKLDPRGYHITNIVLHVIATLLVFGFVFLLTGSNLMSGITALFFGIHPLHVESVAWVSGRKDPLYVIFYLGACISYVCWVRGRKPKAAFYGGALALFVLSLLAKGMAVCLPGALLAIDFFLRRKPTARLLLEKAPFFLIALVFGYAAVVAQSKQGAVQNLASFAFYERILFACYGISSYLIRAVVPGELSALYPYPLRTAGGGLPLIYYLAPLGVLIFAAAVAWSLRTGRSIAFGAIFFLVNVALVLQLFPVGSAVIADRYTYLSYVGVGFMLASIVRSLTQGGLARSVAARGAVAAVLAIAATLAVFASRARCEVWKDNVTLWNDVLRQYPTLPMGYTMRARTYMQRGRNDLALSDAQKALSLDPKQARALTMRGTIRYLNRDNQGALTDLEKAVALEPKEAVPWNSLGAVHLTLGRHDLALVDFTRAVELKSDYAEAYLNRALTLSGMNRVSEAMPDFDASIRLQPGNARAYLWRGEAKSLLGDKAGAAEDYGRALALEPNNAPVWYARAKAYERLSRYDEALRDAARAQELGYPLPAGYLELLRGRGSR